MLGRLGLGNTEEDEESDTGVDPEAPARSSPATVMPVPRSGSEAWGRWSHEEDSISLELTLPDGLRAKQLICEVSKEGVMRVEGQGEQLLSGRLALPCDRSELAWLVDEQDDGSRLLCIEVPMLPIDTSRRLASVDCIFDESLRVNGEPCLTPGLSGVEGKAP